MVAGREDFSLVDPPGNLSSDLGRDHQGSYLILTGDPNSPGYLILRVQEGQRVAKWHVLKIQYIKHNNIFSIAEENTTSTEIVYNNRYKYHS